MSNKPYLMIDGYQFVECKIKGVDYYFELTSDGYWEDSNNEAVFKFQNGFFPMRFDTDELEDILQSAYNEGTLESYSFKKWDDDEDDD